MEEELKANFDDMNIELIEGEFGAFDIIFNDKLIFSKGKESGTGNRFPRKGEITGLIERKTRENAGG